MCIQEKNGGQLITQCTSKDDPVIFIVCKQNVSQLLILMEMSVGVESEHGRFDGGGWVEESCGGLFYQARVGLFYQALYNHFLYYA